MGAGAEEEFDAAEDTTLETADAADESTDDLDSVPVAVAVARVDPVALDGAEAVVS